ncbi:MAG: deoxyguanosinetriphosphate triphosphohydrolase [Clostridia bacterium]|nr:deoxyguanosinetriphosphate triphosphohydrolase [Clostridia bacterium]
MTVRQMLYEREKSTLSPYATLSSETKGRDIYVEPCTLRTEFQRDRDRITHSKAFRRLMHKTQVFLSPEADHYRTRLTHTLEVAQIGRTIARALRLNEDLCEAIGLGHDLGHTPFGHAGERTLRECYSPDFSHNAQSLRVVEKLESLNLTVEVRDGILNHVWGTKPMTPEGWIIQFADRIAYINHDIDDAVRAGVMKESDIPEEILRVVGYNHSDRINTMVTSVIRASGDGREIKMEPHVLQAMLALHRLMFELVYHNPVAKGEEGKAGEMITMLYNYMLENPEKLPEEYSMIAMGEGIERAAADFISGMTDRYAISIYKEFFIPESWGVK